jgi:hypothetical protein
MGLISPAATNTDTAYGVATIRGARPAHLKRKVFLSDVIGVKLAHSEAVFEEKKFRPIIGHSDVSSTTIY